MIKGIFLLFTFFANMAFGSEIWECVSPNGKKVFSNLPCAKEQEKWNFVTQETTVINGFDKSRSQPAPNHQNIRPLLRQKNNVIMNNNKLNSLDCQNAKRAWKFENDNELSKSYNKERLRKDVWIKCGTWPKDL